MRRGLLRTVGIALVAGAALAVSAAAQGAPSKDGFGTDSGRSAVARTIQALATRDFVDASDRAAGVGAAAAESGQTTLAAAGDPTISAPPDVVVGEADGFVDLSVRLSTVPSNQVLVTWTISAITADSGTSCGGSGGDYDAPGSSNSGQLAFSGGQTTQTVHVVLTNCNDVEGLVSFALTLSQPSGGTIARTTTLVGILDATNVVTTPRLSVRDAVVDAMDGSVLVPVLLGGARGQSSNTPVVVNWATSPRSAQANVDYASVNGTLTFAPGETAKTIVVPILNPGPKPPKSFAVVLSGASGADVVDDTGIVLIEASAALKVPLPVLSAPADVVAGEIDGYVDLPVRLSAPGESPVTVAYDTEPSTAREGSGCGSTQPDYANRSGTLIFAPGETAKVVRVPLIDCTDPEGLVSFLLELSDPVNATIGRASSLVSIVNDSRFVTTPPGPKLFVRDAVVDRTDGSVLVPVLLGGPGGQVSANTVSVHYATGDRTATAGEDYEAVDGTLTFAPGETAKTVVIPIVEPTGDFAPQPQETFALSLNGPVGGATIADGTGTIVLGPSSSARVPEPRVSAPPDVVVGEGDGYVDLPVRLSAPGQNPVTVNYATASGAASPSTSCDADYVTADGTLTFAPGETTKVVRVQLIDCVDVEGLVSFRFELNTPGNATIARSSTMISIADDSTSVSTPPGPRLFVRDAVVDQKDGSVLVPVLLGGPRGQTSNSTVTVDYATSDMSAVDGVDYAAVSGKLSFAPGQTVKTVVVPIDDVGPKGLKRFALTLSNAVNGVISDATGVVTIGASPATPVPTPSLLAPPDVIVGEADGYVDLVVRLSAPGVNPVTVSYDTDTSIGSSGSSCGTLNPDFVNRTGTLNFVPGETTKVVRIQLLDCVDVEAMSSFKFVLTGSPANATIGRSTTLVSILNASTVVATPRLVVRDAQVDQKDGSVLVPVLLGGPSGQASDSTVTVHYATNNGTAVAGIDYQPVSGTLSFAPGQTVKNIVVPLIDAVPKESRSFSVTLSSVTNASIVDATGIVLVDGRSGAAVAPPTLPTLSTPADITVDEADGYVDLGVRLSVPSVNPVSVTFTTATNSGATSGNSCSGTNPDDYVSTTGSLTFAPGETTKVVRVQLLDCVEVEGLVSFRFTISLAVGATIVRPTTIVGLVDNQSAWTPTNTGLPVVSGTPQPGQTLTATQGAWSGAPTGFQFRWQRCDAGGGACSSIDNATGSTYVATAQDTGRSLRVEVTATNTFGTSFAAYSVPVYNAPGAPQNVTAAARNGEAFVSFTPLSESIGSISYTVTSSPGGFTASGVQSPILVTGLTNGVTYTFTVVATNPAGTGPPSAPSNPVVPTRRPPLPPNPPTATEIPDVPPFTPPAGGRPPKPPPH